MFLFGAQLPLHLLAILGLPVETERQSGYLFYGGKTTSPDRSRNPYYWAFRPEMDATFYAHYIETVELWQGSNTA